MYNSKDLVVDEDLTFLSYNQTINAEFTLEEILDSPLWIVNSDNGLIKAIPLFNCDKITSSNSSDKVLDSNKCVILENDMDTIVKCISDDTGSMHYHSVELYAYAPYTKLDVISEVTVYCILHDEYLNTVGNVNVDVYIDDELSGSVLSDSNGVCRFKVDQPCTVKFVYGELESNIVVIDEPQIYTLSIETDKSSLFTDESVTVTGVLTVDGEVYADQSIALYDGLSLIDTVVTDSNGEYTKTVSGLSVGAHVFRAVHAHVRSGTVSVSVNAHSYSLSIASDKQSILTTESVTISGVLLKDSGAFSGQSVALYDGSSLVDTLSTDSNGAYEKTLTGLSVGVHTFKAVNTNAESTTVSVTVSEPTPVHNYTLSVTGTAIIQTGDNDNITATLKDNGVVVSGETLNYQIKHGSTVIDSGSDTTDSNGEISITYTGTGVGDIEVIVEYGSLLQETFVVEDCLKYYPLTDNSHESAFTIPSGVTLSYSSNGMRLSANAYKQIKLTDKLTSDCSVEFTLFDYSYTNYSAVIVYAYTNGETTPNKDIIMGATTNTNNRAILGTRLNRDLVKGAKYRIEYTSSTLKVYENDVLLGSASNNVGLPTRFEWHMGANSRYVVYKDLKVKAL